MKLFAFAVLALMLSSVSFAQTAVVTIQTNGCAYPVTVSGTVSASGGTLSGSCITTAPTQPTTPVTPPPVAGACDTGQLSSPLGTIRLKRQCVTTWAFSDNKFGLKGTQDSTNDFGSFWFKGANYAWGDFPGGYSITPSISSGYYVSLALKIPAGATTGSVQLTNDPTFGDGGLLSLSTVPGALLTGQPNVVCAFARGASISMYVELSPGAYCKVTPGNTYYVNFANANPAGVAQCFNGSPGACSQSQVSFSAIIGK